MEKKLKINSEFINNIVDILLEKDLAEEYDIIVGINEEEDCFTINMDSIVDIREIKNEI